ncbi:hypothetical protein K431DRAFT_171254 [Polychaeton citri CBS 116435]|uniref:Zn(2)-C6 fungal-type domain-containing protein n=1 Tax=Polychaeton citri CBS 116435 TaxID=1314669 RepID=A0A9P4PXK4_9PEZI|nr:hypothetical protein K431DRAFT_171254 [Polychaeton citri CBS 116435]
MEPPRKRRRPALSCVPCRLRKVKCDREIPCGQCSRTSAVSTCYYDSDVRLSHASTLVGTAISRPEEQAAGYVSRSDGSRRPVAGGSSLAQSSNWAAMNLTNPLSGILPGESIVDWPDREDLIIAEEPDAVSTAAEAPGDQPTATLETDRQSHSQSVNAFASAREVAQLRTTVHLLGQKLYQLDKRVRSSTGVARQADCFERPPQSSGSNSHVSVGSHYDNDHTVALTQPRLRLAPDKIKYWGPSHYIQFFDTSEMYNKLKGKNAQRFSADIVRSGILALVDDVRGLRRQIKDQNHVTFQPYQHLHQSLPSKDMCDRLIENYFSTLHIMYPIVDQSDFTDKYVTYRTQLDQSQDEAFGMKLSLALAIGTVFQSTSTEEHNTLKEKATRWVYTAQWFLDGPSEKSRMNLEGLQIRCLALLSRQCLSVGSVESIWISAGALLRHAMSLGLHLDPFQMIEFTPKQAEERRRLWSVTLEMVVGSAIAAGQAPLFDIRAGYTGEASSDEHDELQHNLNNSNESGSLPHLSGTLLEKRLQNIVHKSLAARFEAARLFSDPASTLRWKSAEGLLETLAESSRLLSSMTESVSWQCHRASQSKGPYEFYIRLWKAQLAKYAMLLSRPFAVTNQGAIPGGIATRANDSLYKNASEMLRCSIGEHMKFDDTSNFWRLMMSANGSFKSGISFDAIIVLCQHLLSKVDSDIDRDGRVTIDAKNDMEAQLQAWSWLGEGLGQLMSHSNPSTKRYIYFTAKHAQIKAVLQDGDRESGLINGTRAALEFCKQTLSKRVSRAQPEDGTDVTTAHAYMGNNDFDNALDPPLFDINFDLDPSWFQGLFTDISGLD